MIGYLLLLLSTMIWALGFIAVKWSLTFLNGFEVSHVRFFIAGLLGLAIILVKKEIKARWSDYLPEFFCSIFVFMMLTLQTVGLTYTSVAKSGFITTLYVIFTPLLMMILFRKRYGLIFWLSTIVALWGIFLLADLQWNNFNIGDLMTLGCALAASFHIVAVDYFAPKIKNGFIFNCYQCLFMAIFSILIFPWTIDADFAARSLSMNEYGWGGVIFLGIFSSLLAFAFQISSQKKLPAHTVAMMFLIESPFAAIFGYGLLGETLSPMAILGCFLVFLAAVVVSSEARLKNEREQ